VNARVLYAGAALAALGCYVASIVASPSGSLAAVAWTLASGAAAAGAVHGARHVDPKRRRPWAFVAVATGVWFAGQLVWDAADLVGTPGYPMAGDAFWLTAALFLILAGADLRSGASRVRRVLDLDAVAVVVGLTALALGWLYGPIAHSSLGLVATVVTVAYAVLYGAALVLWVETLASTPGARGQLAPLAVLAGAVCNGVAWVVYGTATLEGRYDADHAYGLLWVVGQLALGAGPLLAERDVGLPALSPLDLLRRRALLPAFAFLVVIATTIAFAVDERPLGARIALLTGLLVLGGVLFFRNRLATRLAAAIWNDAVGVLEQRNAELEAFAHSVSHDLKAPLVSIQGLASSLERTNGERLDEKGTHYLERVQANAVSMQHLVDDLLLFARVGVDRPYGAIDADAIARDAVDEARATGASVELVTPIPSVCAHPVRFRQALANMIDNGVRYGRSAVRVSARTLPDCVEVAVEDDGPGIDAAERERVFELFTRGRAGLDGAPDGTGFGLALVRRIAVASGGSVRYEERAPRGARFVLSLPKGTS
jgi:signal transduction histidine kinase